MQGKDAEASAVRQVLAQAHPDVAALRRLWNGDRRTFYGDIRVEDVRRGLQLFQKSAGAGGWRPEGGDDDQPPSLVPNLLQPSPGQPGEGLLHGVFRGGDVAQHAEGQVDQVRPVGPEYPGDVRARAGLVRLRDVITPG